MSAMVRDYGEVANAYVQLLLISEDAPSLNLMDHDAEGAALVIDAVVDRCAKLKADLEEVSFEVELTQELGLRDGTRLKHGEQPRIRVEKVLGRQMEFPRAT